MQVSEIQIGPNVLVENHTDSHTVFCNEYSKQCFLEDFGDLEVKFDAKTNVYKVPLFTEIRAEYSKIKAEDCGVWGCE
jgi:hypothetical protein